MRLTIEKLVEGGDGLARNGGKTIFVAGALPMEEVMAEIVEDKGDFARAVVQGILNPSPDRVVPACPYYQQCGGCDLQHLAGSMQSVHKERICKENLKRIGGLDIDSPEAGVVMLPIAVSPAWGYRSRVRFHVDLANGRTGFLAGKSDDLVDIDSCPVLCPSLDRLLGEKRPLLLKAARMRRANEGWQAGKRYVEVPAFAGDRGVSLSSHEVSVEVLGKSFLVDSNVFFQSNRLVLPAMVDFVRDRVTGKRIMDLYSGVGTFAAFVEGEGRSVVAVERDARCLELASKNLQATEFFTQSAEHWARSRKAQAVSTVIVDPPRGGLDETVVAALGSWRPKTILYISCNSVTLARDIKRLSIHGYRVKAFQMFDLYPQTSHTEVAVSLEKTHV
ncbi:MAG: class I SAM-dependent RNA methyltransferase [Spirochaetae bacterium HGW-Spirochaetae-8]|nr:MAG: class I SAM-dependent RNA methyltransferase [Spirochaetae bacterium HGW-Spirochaetae-8]